MCCLSISVRELQITWITLHLLFLPVLFLQLSFKLAVTAPALNAISPQAAPYQFTPTFTFYRWHCAVAVVVMAGSVPNMLDPIWSKQTNIFWFHLTTDCAANIHQASLFCSLANCEQWLCARMLSLEADFMQCCSRCLISHWNNISTDNPGQEINTNSWVLNACLCK